MTCWDCEELGNYRSDNRGSGVPVALASTEGNKVKIYRITLSIVDINVNQTVNSTALLH